MFSIISDTDVCRPVVIYSSSLILVNIIKENPKKAFLGVGGWGLFLIEGEEQYSRSWVGTTRRTTAVRVDWKPTRSCDQLGALKNVSSHSSPPSTDHMIMLIFVLLATSVLVPFVPLLQVPCWHQHPRRFFLDFLLYIYHTNEYLENRLLLQARSRSTGLWL